MDNVQYQDFAKVCIKNGIAVLDSPANREKAKLIAKRCGISDFANLPILQRAIDEYIASEREKKNKERDAEIKAIKGKENAKKKDFEKYADKHGRDKPIAFCDEYIFLAQQIVNGYNETQEASKTIRNTYAALGASLEPIKSPPKQDWAIAGGIASAIAGPAAGIAIASDIQRKNAQNEVDVAKAKEEADRARATYNDMGESLAKQVISNGAVSREDYRKALRDIDHYKSLKEKFEISLVEDSYDPHQLLNTLNPIIQSLSITTSGSVSIKVKITGATYTIFEGTKAVIDGSFGALLWNKNGLCCGSAVVVLPINGAYKDIELEALITTPKSTSESYYVDFTDPNLWLIETDIKDSLDGSILSDVSFSKETETYYMAYSLLFSQKLSNIKKAH